VASLAPVEGTLLHFRGDLGHEVTAVQGSETRLSLVCEQYRLPEAKLAGLEPVSVTSRGLFERYMDAAKNKTPDVTLD
jgi:hypothetical protein